MSIYATFAQGMLAYSGGRFTIECWLRVVSSANRICYHHPIIIILYRIGYHCHRFTHNLHQIT
jgi:hypothetical protein